MVSWLEATPTGAFITARMASRATTCFQASRLPNPPQPPLLKGSKRISASLPLWKRGRGDFVPHSSVASPFRAFRVFRSALVPKSLQSSAFSLSYLPEQLQAGVTVPGVPGEVTVDSPMKLCVDNSGAGSRPWEGFRRQGPGRLDAVPARLTAACGQRVPSAASFWHFLCYTILPWHGGKDPGARRSLTGRNGHR